MSWRYVIRTKINCDTKNMIIRSLWVISLKKRQQNWQQKSCTGFRWQWQTYCGLNRAITLDQIGVWHFLKTSKIALKKGGGLVWSYCHALYDVNFFALKLDFLMIVATLETWGKTLPHQYHCINDDSAITYQVEE